MPSITLDANVVKNAKCPEGKNRVDFYDTTISGFIVEVRATGSKTYYLRYRDQHGKQKQYKIGDTTAITFDQAKAAAQTLKAKVTLGESPAAQRTTLRKVPTMESFATEHYLPYVKSCKRAWETNESVLKNHILPIFGKLHLDEITQPLIVKHHLGMKERGYAAATSNRVVITLRYMYNLAKKWNVAGSSLNPAVGISLFEENNKRERFLNAAEVQTLMAAVQKSKNPQLKYIVPLLLLTGCRKSELLLSKWSDFSLERRMWRIPMSKSGKARHVPLSDDVLTILKQLPRFDGCPYVVPNPESKQPFSDIFHSWDAARKAAGMPDLRLHDLRHSLASFMVNAGRSLYEVQSILGHSQLNTTQRYAHLSQATLLEATNAASIAAGLRLQG